MMTETVVTVQPNQAPNNNTTKPSESQTLSWLKINLDYFRTLPGKLKIAEIIIGIICMSLASPAFRSGTHFFLFVVTISFIGSLIWMFVRVLGIREALTLPIDWVLSEFANTGICAVLYGIAFIVQLVVWSTPATYYRTANIIAGVFGIFNTLVYGIETYLLHKQWKSTRVAN
ncbi:PREDICTED: uncharacterized protein LOC108565679 [Nicrophorus vespilloides]|uniref:Uncharacterized protein LOC108565679 n=1 Tax=Nicrophorus vespilloides TaxID=110193 RepID=A0ABM1N1P4_NICVS|nr:PREDICTED: uncharacterized protein LOC108565679 [Nicrophorus vespilloides]